MSNQETLEMLADIECEKFYRYADMSEQDPNHEKAKTEWQIARNTLESFAKATGCHF